MYRCRSQNGDGSQKVLNLSVSKSERDVSVSKSESFESLSVSKSERIQCRCRSQNGISVSDSTFVSQVASRVYLKFTWVLKGVMSAKVWCLGVEVRIEPCYSHGIVLRLWSF